MPQNPFFTVGIPTFNRAHFIKSTLDAVLSQSFTDFEVLVYDNASTDGTRELVKSYTDPRIRYLSQNENVGPCRNFVDTTAAALGDFIIINQDDDLLHCDFLARCYEAVKNHPEVSLYAAPAWREKRGRGYQGRLLRCNEGYEHDFLLNDRVIYMQGERMAVSMLNLFYYFYHPSLAIRRSALREAGGYVSREDSLYDIVTEACVLMHGDLAYDPRPGAMYRDHGENEWKSYGRERRKRMLAGTLDEILKQLKLKDIPWEGHFDKELKGYSTRDLEVAIKEWCWCGAPDVLVRKGVQELRARDQRSALKSNLRLLRLLGPSRFIKRGFARKAP